MYKVKNHLAPLPVQEVFNDNRINHNLRNERSWEIPRVQTEIFGKETIRYRGIITWDLLPKHIKESKSLSIFKTKIKDWTPEGCTCRLCKEYIFNLGYL